jgi:hypothetical protein
MAPKPAAARAIRMPDGKILLTNQEGPTDHTGARVGQTYARSGARDLGAREMYQAAKAQLNAAPAPEPAQRDWRTGTTMEGPATRSLGRRRFLPDGGFTADQVQGTPGGGSFTGSGGPLGEGSISDNPETAARLSHEDAARRVGAYSDEAAVEEARQAAEFAKLPPSTRAQLKAAEKAPELIGFDAVRQLYAEQGAKRNTLNTVLQTWRQRSQKEGDPLYVEPQNRALAERMKVEELSSALGVLSDAQVKDLISTLAQQRLPQGIPGLGG